MNAQDYLNEAQNYLDRHEDRTTDLARAAVAAQMAMTMAIMEQTEAIKANYRLAHEAINEVLPVQYYYPNDAKSNAAEWGLDRLAPPFAVSTPLDRATASGETKPDSFRDGARIYRVGDFVHDPERNLVGKIMAVHHDSAGSELEVHFGDDEAIRISVWSVDPIEEPKP